ncbi:MAG: D-alanyl-D-alanine carboxypeptidase/D-alanyl-D-alanine-endopeptidase [Gemmatimonadaceae bacterium]|nr:D-alanyl-D-alanine carboxypeptidase/D-alanyl-D-alanine-endopeptidase [Gemmatimonadaceae bacterium]
MTQTSDVACSSRFAPTLRTLALLIITCAIAVSVGAQKPTRKQSTARRTVNASARAVPRSGSAAARNRLTRTKQRTRLTRPSRSVAPLVPGTAFGLDGLRADLGTLAGTSIRNGSWGMMVVSLSHGDTLFSINADVPHVPASTQKVLTSVLALNSLGPQYRYHTEVLHTGTMQGGTIDGDLILRGDGDPTLSARFIGGKPDAAMDSLAARVVKAGVRVVTGRVIGDASAFEARSVPEGWHPRILQDAYAGRVSGLSLNENLVWVTIRPGTRGGAADVVLEPATAAIALHSTVRTVPGRTARLKMARNSNGISVSGTIGTDVFQRSYSYIVEDPASFTTGAFLAALKRNGVTVGNGFALAKAPANAESVTSWESAPLETLLTVMNRESVNVIAEHVFRAAARGADRHTTGSAVVADTALRSLLERSAGVRADAVTATDGSGLSQLDRVSPRAMIQLLGWADKSSWGPLLHASMPLAGESGTLRNRMKYSTAQTNLHAKTGTTNDVVALAGYVTARNGELLAFAMLYNGRDRWRAREAIDAIGITLANWSR